MYLIFYKIAIFADFSFYSQNSVKIGQPQKKPSLHDISTNDMNMTENLQAP
jgi:hypothetical protein